MLLPFLLLSLILNANIANCLYNTESIIALFDHEKCMEASLLTASNDQVKNMVIDKESLRTDTLLINATTKIATDKSILSKIHELAQYNEIEATYRLLSEEGPDHGKLYKVALKLGDEEFVGSGSSLKKAKQEAAQLALKSTKYEYPLAKNEEQSDEVEEKILTPTVVLNNIALKLGLSVSYYLQDSTEKEITLYHADSKLKKSYYEKLNESIYTSLKVPSEAAQISGPFSVKVTVADLSFIGVGHTIQAARHDAASRALKEMEKQALLKDNICSIDESAEACKRKKEALKSAISRVYEAAHRHNLDVDFTLIDESGKSHEKFFTIECKLGKFKTQGEGKSKKEAKRNAAENMIENLQYLPESYDENLIIKNISGNKKKKKTKKNKIIRNGITQTIGDKISSFFKSDDTSTSSNNDNNNINSKTDKNKSNRKSSAKDTILNVGNKLNFEIQFSDLDNIGDKFYSLVSLGFEPPHICLGDALSKEKSQDVAALNGLKLLQNIGLLDKIGYAQHKIEIKEWINEVMREQEADFYSDDAREK